MSQAPWFDEAQKHIGQSEIKGAQHNPRIVKWFAAIRAPFTDDETPWCAAFVGGCLEAVSLKSSRSAAARSYLTWGAGLSRPVLGCICVFERGPQFGHVGFLAGIDGQGNLMVLGGNQGDAVNIRAFPRSRLLGFRWPATVPMSDEQPPLYRNGAPISTGEA